MVLVNGLMHWSYVCLLSTRNDAIAKLLAQIIKLRAHYPNYPIKSIRMEMLESLRHNYYMSVGIEVEHPVHHVHTQNGLI